MPWVPRKELVLITFSQIWSKGPSQLPHDCWQSLCHSPGPSSPQAILLVPSLAGPVVSMQAQTSAHLPASLLLHATLFQGAWGSASLLGQGRPSRHLSNIHKTLHQADPKPCSKSESLCWVTLGTSIPVLDFSLQVLNKRHPSLPGLCPSRYYTCCELLLARIEKGTVGDQNWLQLFSQKGADFRDMGKTTTVCKHIMGNLELPCPDCPGVSSCDSPLAQP